MHSEWNKGTLHTLDLKRDDAKDLATIESWFLWFGLLQKTHGILNQNIYNFDGDWIQNWLEEE